MEPVTRVLPKRGKKMRYTLMGAVPVVSDADDDLMQPQVEQDSTQPGLGMRKGRGPVKIVQARLPSEREEIWPVGKEEFSCAGNPSQITTVITRLALQIMPGLFISFLQYDLRARLELETLFLQRFTFRSTENVNYCREVLEAVATKRYCAELRQARKKCIKEHGWNTEEWKRMVPHWCKTYIFLEGLCDIYGTVEYQQLSKQNHKNRCSSGLTVTHYTGSISAHQHNKNLIRKKILGRDAIAEELFVHLHVSRIDGVSLVVAQAEAAKARALEMQAIDDENREETECPDPEQIIVEVQAFETSAMQFANTKSKEVYEKAKDMHVDPEYAGREDIELFGLAADKKSHIRDWGFGSQFEDSIPTTARSGSRATCGSSVLTTSEGLQEQRNVEFQQILQERDDRFGDEINKRDKIIESYDLRFTEMAAKHKAEQVELHSMITHLYGMCGLQKPMYQGHGAMSQPFQSAPRMHVPPAQGPGELAHPSQGDLGINMPLYQAPTALNYGALLGMQMPNSQMHSQVSQGLGMEAFIAAQASSGEAAMTNWCSESNRES